MSDETAWLIELAATPAIGPQWLTSSTWHPNWPKHKAEVWKFSPSANEAIRFSRKEDAQRILDILFAFCGMELPYNKRDLFVSEHAWIERDASPSADKMLDWLQRRAEEGCVTMCFELDGGVHVTLDPAGGEQRAAREVDTVREGIARLMMNDNAKYSPHSERNP